MRILEVTESFAAGTMEVVRVIAEAAVREGHEVVIAHGRRPETPPDIALELASDIGLIPLPWSPRTLAANAKVLRSLRRLGREQRPDVVHLHSSFAGFVGSLALAGSYPTVYTPHGYSVLRASSRPQRSAYGVAERLVARRVDLIGAVSAAEARQARGFGARAVRVIPNGIPELDSAPADGFVRREGRPLVVAMGRMDTARLPVASARILRGVADLADVVWIGGGSEEEAVASLGVPVTGWLPREQALRRLADATAMLNWSAWDANPLSVLEAIALDVAVVGSDIDANRELVGEEQLGSSETEAIDLLRRILTDPEQLIRTLGEQRGRSGGRGAGKMVERWLSAYRDLAAGRAQTAQAESVVAR